MKLEISQHIFEKKKQISYFTTVHPMAAKLFHMDRQTDGRTDVQTWRR